MSDASFRATSAPHYLTTIYNDLRPVLNSYSGSGSNPPTFTKFAGSSGSQGVFAQYFTGGIGGPSVERELYMTCQLPHDYAEGSSITPHIHFAIDTGGSNATTAWGFEYTYAPIGSSFPSTTSNIITTQVLTGYTTNTHYVLDFPTISLGTLGISSLLICRLYRGTTASVGSLATDTYPGGIFLLDFDLHYISNTPGSRQTNSK